MELTYAERLAVKLSDPQTMDIICRHVASGGTLVTLAETWQLSFGDLSSWVNADPDRLKRYTAALNDRAERFRETILHELSLMGRVRMMDLFDERGEVKDPLLWPESIRAAVKSIEYGNVLTKDQRRPIIKVTFHDKKQAMELHGKNLALFIERHQIDGKFDLDEFLKQVEKIPARAAAPAKASVEDSDV